MRYMMIASLVLVSGLGVACESDSGDDGGAGASAGASSGGTSGGTGGHNAGGGNMGGDSGADPEAPPRGDTTKATGSDPLIDDFTDSDTRDPSFAIIEADGRSGQWVHGHFLDWGAGLPEAVDGVMQITCEAGGGEGHEQCNTEWDAAEPWEQSAAVDALLQTWGDPLNCYDVEGVYTGLTFKARGVGADQKIWVQVLTPDSDGDISYRSETLSLEADVAWDSAEAEFSVSFDDFEVPDWAASEGWRGPSSPDLTCLQSIAFVVRNVEDMESGSGEKLLPYDIQIDDLAFTK